MVSTDVHVLFTMDCEPAAADVTPYALEMSGSGPPDYEASERSIRAYVATLEARGFPATLFAHPEVAVANRDLLLELQDGGACLGLHVHPYKLRGGEYRYDLGAYEATRQREILRKAVSVWEGALGQKPLYFRAGYFSANDATFGVLQELGLRGGSLSNPGRVLPEHCSVWAGAEPYPHRAHLGFRQIVGDSDFVEIPVSVAFRRPFRKGEAREVGYEWPYVPASKYDHRAVVKDILERVVADSAQCGTIVADTHNDQDYSDPDHPASVNLAVILDAIASRCAELRLRPVGCTVADVCDRILSP